MSFQFVILHTEPVNLLRNLPNSLLLYAEVIKYILPFTVLEYKLPTNCCQCTKERVPVNEGWVSRPQESLSKCDHKHHRVQHRLTACVCPRNRFYAPTSLIDRHKVFVMTRYELWSGCLHTQRSMQQWLNIKGYVPSRFEKLDWCSDCILWCSMDQSSLTCFIWIYVWNRIWHAVCLPLSTLSFISYTWQCLPIVTTSNQNYIKILLLTCASPEKYFVRWSQFFP